MAYDKGNRPEGGFKRRGDVYKRQVKKCLRKMKNYVIILNRDMICLSR